MYQCMSISFLLLSRRDVRCMTEGAAGLSAGKKGNTANQEQKREPDFPGNTTLRMSQRQVLAGRRRTAALLRQRCCCSV